MAQHTEMQQLHNTDMGDTAIELTGTIFETASAKKTFARKMATSSSRTTGSSFGIKNPIMHSIDKNQPGTT